MQTSGFGNAPVSRWLVILVIVASTLATITDTKILFWISVNPHLTTYRQYWRLLTWQVCYTNSTEVLFAALTLYQMRVIERLWGSRKFLSFLVSTLPYTTLLPPLVVALILRPLSLGYVNYLPAGPTAIAFAILAQFHAAVPYAYRYRISGSTTVNLAGRGAILTSKSVSYLLPLQLAASQLPGSAVAAVIGWLVGAAYRLDMLPGASAWRIPFWRDSDSDKARYEGLRRMMEGNVGVGDHGSGTGLASSSNEPGSRRR